MQKINEKGTHRPTETHATQKDKDIYVRSELSSDNAGARLLQNKANSSSVSADADNGYSVRSACPICGSDKLIHSCNSVQDIGLKSSEPKIYDPLKSTETSIMLTADKDHASSEEECSASYIVIHLGSTTVDRRFPPKSIMPWVMAEVKRSRDTFKEISLNVMSHTLKAVSYDDSSSKYVRTVFEHKLNSVSRFAKTHQDPRCFGYLRRESLYSDFECHVFLAHDEKVVSTDLDDGSKND